MQTTAPTFGRIAIATGFALSCFGLLLFLWIAFGGPVPLAPKSYRVDITFDEATQLAVESDVRISGVSVGKVKSIELNENGLADATLEIDAKYSPIPTDTEAILRQKTLLGETYVELTPGNGDGPYVPEGGNLAVAQVSDAVQLDEIFRAFDEPTRQAFRTWMVDAAGAFKGRGSDLNDAIGTLDPFVTRGDDLLRILDSQDQALAQLIDDGGQTFDAISERPEDLRSLIQNTESVFSTTAARNEQLRELFIVLPTFLRESDLTLNRLDEFATLTDPLVTQLRPSARELSGTFLALRDLAPELEEFFTGLDPVIDNAETGFTALRAILDSDLPPVLGRVDSYFDQLIPIVDTINAYRREVTAFLGNVSSAANGVSVPSGSQKQVKYLRGVGPLNLGTLASPPSLYKTSRLNAYIAPGGQTKLATGLENFVTAQCASGLTATVNGPGDIPEELYADIKELALGGVDITSTDQVPATPCKDQGTQRSIGGAPRTDTDFLQVRPEG